MKASLVILLLTLLVLFGCKKETDPAPPAGPTPTPAQNAYRFPWKNDLWTEAAIKSFESRKKDLPDLPYDILEFCPGGIIKNKVEFYAFLLSEVSRWESDFDPNQSTYECDKLRCRYSGGCQYNKERGYCMKGGHALDGGLVVSRGLLQISLESAQYEGCTVKTPEELNDPLKNIDCGAQIFSRLMKKSNSIGDIDGNGKWDGLSNYWAVMRGTTSYTRDSLNGIKQAMKDYCK